MVELPLWLVVLALILAAIAALERVLMPSARWFLRRRAERLVGRLNTHLSRPIRPFRLMARADRIVQLTYDREVVEAAMAHAAETGTPEPVVFQQVRKAAAEIVPGFSASSISPSPQGWRAGSAGRFIPCGLGGWMPRWPRSTARRRWFS